MIAIVAFSWGNHLQPLTVNWVLGKHSSSVLNIFEQATSAALYFQLCLGRPGGTGCMPSSLGSMARRCWTVTQCWAEVYNSTVLYFLQLNSLKSGDDLGFWRTKQRERGGKEQKWFSQLESLNPNHVWTGATSLVESQIVQCFRWWAYRANSAKTAKAFIHMKVQGNKIITK